MDVKPNAKMKFKRFAYLHETQLSSCSFTNGFLVISLQIKGSSLRRKEKEISFLELRSTISLMWILWFWLFGSLVDRFIFFFFFLGKIRAMHLLGSSFWTIAEIHLLKNSRKYFQLVSSRFCRESWCFALRKRPTNI